MERGLVRRSRWAGGCAGIRGPERHQHLTLMTAARRRHPLLRTVPRGVATSLLVAAAVACAERQSTVATASGRKPGSCRPELPCWPSVAEWQSLGQKLTGTLLQPRSPLEPCAKDFASAGCSRALE